MRLESGFGPTRELANRPTQFRETWNPDAYVVIPRVSSERRRYVPMGFLDKDTIPTDSVIIIPEASIYHFGILTSNVHMAWMRVVAGRLKVIIVILKILFIITFHGQIQQKRKN